MLIICPTKCIIIDLTLFILSNNYVFFKCFKPDLLVSNNCQMVRLSKLEQDLILALTDNSGKNHQQQTRHLKVKKTPVE